MNNYVEVNIDKTNKLLEKLSNNLYVSKKKANKMGTLKFALKYMKTNWKILDIGCRDGMWLDILKKNKFENLQGVDVSEKALNISRKRGHNVMIADAQELPFEDESFDFVSLIHTLEHCPDVDKVLKGIYRILKPGGRILVVVPLQKKEPVPTVWAHFYCFSTTGEVCTVIKRNGFKKVKINGKQKGHNRFLYQKPKKRKISKEEKK